MIKFDKGDLVQIHFARMQPQLYLVTDVRRDALGGTALRMQTSADGSLYPVHLGSTVRDEILVVSHDFTHTTWIDSLNADLIVKAETLL